MSMVAKYNIFDMVSVRWLGPNSPYRETVKITNVDQSFYYFTGSAQYKRSIQFFEYYLAPRFATEEEITTYHKIYGP